MAEQTTEEKAGQQAKRKVPLKSAVILAAIMLLEAGLFVAWMAVAQPNNAGAAQGAVVAPQPVDNDVEQQVLNFRAPNWKSGPAIYYQLTISVVCRQADIKLLTAKCEKHQGRIRDRLRAIIARADPELFREEELTTLKRQIFTMIEEVVGEGLIKKVLIPEYDVFRDS